MLDETNHSAWEPGRAAAGEGGRQAVVDIGSNSIRLVIYDGPRRAPAPICNEKALCGLGRDMSADGRLNPAAVDYALSTLVRFRRLIVAHGEPPTVTFATAAVREAADGPEFVARVQALGFDVRVIGGVEEATLAALGVVSYEPGATGLVGDMGGGSLELIAVANGFVEDNISLSIGPLRLMQQTGGKIADAEPLILRALEAVDWIAPDRFDTLYAVGGAWRAIARIHMRLKSYPLSVLHHYELTKEEAIEVCDILAKQSRRSLEEIPGIPRRRIDTLPYAAVVMRAVLQKAKAKKIVVSAGGVREGVLFNNLTADERLADPLFAGAEFFAERLAPEPRIGGAVAALTDTLFADETPSQKRLRVATCILCDIGAFFHPDLRAAQAFDTALRAPFYGVTHKERVSIALSLFCRHDGRRPSLPDEHTLGLLSLEEQQRAIRLGLALRFAGALAPKAPEAIAGCRLVYADAKVTFRAPEAVRSLMGELPRKRLDALASSYEAAAAEEYY
ncbi:MAG: Ppx/GppA family phosphatase [Pseudomonadota bacterium]|nr:Ppx/GppA family phosphatase [Pseudomonadota bacterium]